MNRITHLLVVLLAVAGLASAQTVYQHTIPAGYENTDGNYTIGGSALHGNGLFNTALGNCRWQFSYGYNEFFHQCPILITGISFRRSVDATLIGATYPLINVRMASLGTTIVNHTGMSTTFATNLAADQVLVYSGPVNVPVYTATAAVPAPWLITIPFTTPFPYDPTRTRDLVVDLQWAGAATAAGGFIIDGVFPHPGLAQNAHTTVGTSATRNLNNPDAGAVIRIDYTLGNPVHLDLLAITSGGGAGDLIYQVINIPPAATQGYTLISGLPASSVGVAFGKGPVFGIYPDPLTFSLILLPPGQGDLFHWLLPAGGLFPDTPIVAPPGTLSAFAGQTWELVAITFTNGALSAISPPRQLAW